MIMITGNIRVLSTVNFSLLMGKGVPNVSALAIFIYSTFNLN